MSEQHQLLVDDTDTVKKSKCSPQCGRGAMIAVVSVIGVLAVALLVGGVLFFAKNKNDDNSKPLTIYFFNVGQGDSQLIVFPSGYSVLIDCMESTTTSNATAALIAKKIRNITNSSYVDVGMISHIHTDHIGMPFRGGVWSLVEQQGISFGKIIDRDAANWTDFNSDGKCNSSELVYKYAGGVGTTCTNWVCYIGNPAYTKAYSVREPANLCSTTQIDPPDEDTIVTITAADAIGAFMLNGEPVAANHVGENDAPSENDYSLGILIQFGKLLYSTTGDLSGEYYGSYNNVENYTYPRIGSVDVMKVNHHGSSHSTSDAWVNALSPTVSLISVGATNTYSHPAQAILDKLQAAGSDVYTTQKGNPTANYGNTTVANSDIIITSYDGETFTVQAGNITRTYSSKKNNKPPTCKT